MSNLRKYIVFFGLIFLCAPAFAKAKVTSSVVKPTNSNDVSLESRSYTLEQLTGQKKFILTGLNPSYTLYLPIPKQWKLGNVSFNLIISHSPALNKISSLTAEVNEKPISTILLTEKNLDKATWNITIPKDSLKGDFVTLNIAGFLRISENICSDIDNPGSWAIIGNDSTVTYAFNRLDFIPQLSQLPYPLIDTQSTEIDINTLVLPDNVSSQTLKSTLYFSNLINDQATWRGLNFSTIRINDLINKQIKPTSNTILIGTAQQLSLPKLSNSWPLQITANGTFKGANDTEISPNTGVIMLVSAPWDSKIGLIAITGATEEGVENAALAFNTSTFSKLSKTENYLLIPARPAPKTEIDWGSVTLKKLGYKDKTVYGAGQHTISYMLDLPTYPAVESLQLDVQFDYSQFLLGKRSVSSLALLVNGKPENGLQLTPSKTNRATWQVAIPKTSLMQGINTLDFNFNIHPDEDSCLQYFLSKAWGTIYADTQLKVLFSSKSAPLTLSQFPAIFGTSSVIVLPKDFYDDTKLLNSLVLLMQKTKNNPSNINIMSADAITKQQLANDNVVLIGNTNSNKWLKDTLKSDGDNSSNNKQVIGVIKIITSPWNSKKTAILINTTNNQEIPNAFNLLTDNKIREKLNDNEVIIYSDGKYSVINPASSNESTDTQPGGGAGYFSSGKGNK